MLDKLGRVDVAWKDINLLVRGKQRQALSGGPDVLRAVYGRGLEEDGYLTAAGGDGLFMFVSWDKNGKQSIETIHQYGSATLDKNSKHYADQMSLFTDEKMKQAFFDDSALAANTERSYEP